MKYVQTEEQARSLREGGREGVLVIEKKMTTTAAVLLFAYRSSR